MPKKKKSNAEHTREEAELAPLFRALGDPTRLRLLRFLRARCGPVAVEDGEEAWMKIGPTVGEVCCAVSGSKKITALISHHLKEMRVAGLIAVKRRGKNMICGVQREAIKRLGQFFEDDASSVEDGEVPMEAGKTAPDEVEA